MKKGVTLDRKVNKGQYALHILTNNFIVGKS